MDPARELSLIHVVIEFAGEPNVRWNGGFGSFQNMTEVLYVRFEIRQDLLFAALLEMFVLFLSLVYYPQALASWYSDEIVELGKDTGDRHLDCPRSMWGRHVIDFIIVWLSDGRTRDCVVDRVEEILEE